MDAMKSPASTVLATRAASRTHCHRRHRVHARQRGALWGPYRLFVSSSPETSKVRFARFVSRVLGDARDRGMNDKAIQLATGIGPSTFHRWRRGDFANAPDIRSVTKFCEGLGVPTRSALLALGVEEGRDEPAPAPPTEPDIRRIQRGLVDPNVSDFDKAFVRETLKMLAMRVTNPRRDRLKDHQPKE